jgi:hypothetical protein
MRMRQILIVRSRLESAAWLEYEEGVGAKVNIT